MINILETSKVSAPVFGSALPPISAIPLMRGPAGAVVNHVTIQCRDQGRLLEEAIRDLEVFKKAYYKAEREIRDRDARFKEKNKSIVPNDQHLEEFKGMRYPSVWPRPSSRLCGNYRHKKSLGPL